MRICVRMPNWLGDTVMSLGFLQLLQQAYPDASICIITKKDLEGLIALLPNISEIFTFSKEENKGLKGVWQFGKRIAAKQPFDLFFALPTSFSSALMAYASGAKKRIGFGGEGRFFLLTHVYKKPKNKHRVEDYATLIQLFNPAVSHLKPSIHLPSLATAKQADPYLIINTNSESITSRLPVTKAVELITLFQTSGMPIKLIGGKKEVDYVNEIYELLPQKINVEVWAGKTNLQQLITLIQQAFFMVSSDSGPAHIASASGVPLVVVTGAGDEKNTGPYGNNKAVAVRNGTLPCEPCVKNYCKLAPLPQCLVQLNMQKVKAAADALLKGLKDDDNRPKT